MSSATIEHTFAALADPTRVEIVLRLSRGVATVGDLAEPFAMSLRAVLKHVQVLEAAGLVRTAKQGRVRLCELVPEPIDDGYDYGAKRSPSVLPLSSTSAAPAPLDPTMGYAGTAEERALVKPLVAAATGLVPDAVPDLAVLLWGPLLRGTVVNSK